MVYLRYVYINYIIITMEVNKDKLIEVLSKIEDRLSKIEKYLSTKEEKNTNPVLTKIPKNTIDWDNLIYAISDTTQKNIVKQIYENQYPTITQGQSKLISDIAKQNNVQL